MSVDFSFNFDGVRFYRATTLGPMRHRTVYFIFSPDAFDNYRTPLREIILFCRIRTMTDIARRPKYRK